MTPAIRLAALFNVKAALWVRGRKNAWDDWQQAVSATDTDIPLIWIHCASMGEYELARPVIAALRERYGRGIRIAVSFFSPSGFLQVRGHAQVDITGYLMPDTTHNARRLLDILQPRLLLLIKYEYWIDHILVAQDRKIPVFVAGALFRPDQPYFRSWSALYLPVFRRVERFFVRDQESVATLAAADILQAQTLGDVRIDRVREIAAVPRSFPAIADFVSGEPVIVIGSSWPADDAVWQEALPKLLNSYRVIWAPHEIDPAYIRKWSRQTGAMCTRWSAMGPEGPHPDSRVLIVDHVGDLAHLYQFAHLAYVGGGFGSGLHNILEPLAFGVPVLFGPAVRNFPEAGEARSLGFGAVCGDEATLLAAIRRFEDPGTYAEARSRIFAYLAAGRGGAAVLTQALEPYLK